MKYPAFLLLLLLIIWHCTQPAETPKTIEKPDLYAQITDTTALFDSVMAVRLGADERGMKPYVMAFLKSGPNRGQDSVTAMKLQEGHMANINRMAKEGKLAIAGPFGDNGDWRGIFIFDMKNMEDVKKEVEQDPAIQAGRLAYEIHPWWAGRGSKLP